MINGPIVVMFERPTGQNNHRGRGNLGCDVPCEGEKMSGHMMPSYVGGPNGTGFVRRTYGAGPYRST